MRTALLLITLTLIGGISIVSKASAVDREVSEFLEHRQVLLSVDFSSGSSRLTDEARRELDGAVNDLKGLVSEQKIIRIEGHASPGGDEQRNLVLSMQRAMEVRAYLLAQFGMEFDLFINGYGAEGSPAETVVQLAFYDDTLGITTAETESIITR